MKESTRLIVIGVVLWVCCSAIMGLELMPTLTGVIILALLRSLVEKLIDRKKE